MIDHENNDVCEVSQRHFDNVKKSFLKLTFSYNMTKILKSIPKLKVPQCQIY